MPRDRQGRRIVDCEDKEVIGWLNSWSVDRSGAWVKEEVINWSESRAWIGKWIVGGKPSLYTWKLGSMTFDQLHLISKQWRSGSLISKQWRSGSLISKQWRSESLISKQWHSGSLISKQWRSGSLISKQWRSGSLISKQWRSGSLISN